MQLNTLHGLFVDQVKDIYDFEQQVLRVLPRYARQVTEKKLKKTLENQINAVTEQIKRLEKIFSILDEKKDFEPDRCKAIKGLIKESDETLLFSGSTIAKECALIGILQAILHYEIAAYGSTIAFAELLELHEPKELFKTTLDEKKHADKDFNKIAEGGFFTKSLNEKAVEQTESIFQQLLATYVQKIFDTKNQLQPVFLSLMRDASAKELKERLKEYLMETREQIPLLNQMLKELHSRSFSSDSKGIEALLTETSVYRNSIEDSAVKDCAFIIAAQRMHHVFISLCGTASAFAQLLDHKNVADALTAIVDQEKKADKRLNQLAEGGMFSLGLNKIAYEHSH